MPTKNSLSFNVNVSLTKRQKLWLKEMARVAGKLSAAWVRIAELSMEMGRMPDPPAGPKVKKPEKLDIRTCPGCGGKGMRKRPGLDMIMGCPGCRCRWRIESKEDKWVFVSVC